MKILLTGATGLLGSAIVEAAHQRSLVCNALPRPSLSLHTLSALANALQGYDVLIHAAANTNVEQCEVAPDDCYRDNFLLTELIAIAAAIAKVKMVFISSTGIYGEGQEIPYREYDSVHPPTHHHRSKMMAEQAVISQNPCNLVIRTGWLFGGAAANPKNFVARRIDEAREAMKAKGYIESNTEQRGVPCFNQDIATRILNLTSANWSGVFNCVNTGSASRFEYVRAVIELAGLPLEVRPSNAAAFQRKAKVSNNEMAVNWKMDTLGLPEMPAWRTSLEHYIKNALLAEGVQQ
ncbi:MULTISPECIES: sugar nucleotide-binding protein [unclassified Janthinobacterium]|uniref:SDR family oxidoreductase n=1 Tax=unclassified Janthinobacterium TaxID=2610881 RepID=UPI001608739A|nr:MULTISPECIES: sugar nucleotide-binding protein [unclassified Janthinobacterium]MBB5608598.1 dTDP-4-dehydrorhamnose reductase [Janthinobacterium sp. S3T4]MBB5614119.1 dTDP-4-dehydrorhamnose reductase [Janthinobacterium sp. S3M3]